MASIPKGRRVLSALKMDLQLVVSTANRSVVGELYYLAKNLVAVETTDCRFFAR